jgi:hypothetical protein
MYRTPRRRLIVSSSPAGIWKLGRRLSYLLSRPAQASARMCLWLSLGQFGSLCDSWEFAIWNILFFRTGYMENMFAMQITEETTNGALL